MREQHSIEIKIDDPQSKDVGKTYVITPMDAWATEEWALEALTVCMNAGVMVSDEVLGMGFKGLMALGISALSRVRYQDGKPLLDRLMDCVTIKEKTGPRRINRASDDIQEVKTLLRLKTEVWKLHVNFYMGAGQSTPTA